MSVFHSIMLIDVKKHRARFPRMVSIVTSATVDLGGPAGYIFAHVSVREKLAANIFLGRTVSVSLRGLLTMGPGCRSTSSMAAPPTRS